MAKKKPPTQETNTNGPPLLDCQDFPEVLVRVEANLLRVIEKAGVSTDGLEALPDDAPGRVRDAAASIQFIRHLRAEAREDAEPWQMARLGFYLGATVGMTDTVHGMKTLRAIKEAWSP